MRPARLAAVVVSLLALALVGVLGWFATAPPAPVPSPAEVGRPPIDLDAAPGTPVSEASDAEPIPPGPTP